RNGVTIGVRETLAYEVIAFALKHPLYQQLVHNNVALIGVALAILEGDSEAKEINAYTVQDDVAGSQYSPEDESDLSSAANVVGQFLMKSVGGGSPGKYCVNSGIGMITIPCWYYGGKCGLKDDNGLQCICCTSK
ncbi:hypothetical protein FOZ62_000160, partial [Perkinsus olseni]